MWNGGYQPPSGPPNYGGYGPPSGPPPGQGYAPPPGPPGGFGFPSPSGPPPGAPGWPSASPYAPPPGPPPSDNYGSRGYGGGGGYPGQYQPPTGPPPGSGYPGQYHPPAGPPLGSGYPGQYPATPSHPQPPPPGAAHMPPTGIQNYGPQYQGHDQQMHQPFFQYSQCNGRKKALIIGVNYTGSSAELAGCHNDARNVHRFLCERYNYQQNDIVMLLDGQGGPRQQPTKRNLIEAMQWLTRDARPNDSLFFHFSGHGGQQKEAHGESDEIDGFDETIYPVDFEEAGTIVDDDLHDIMVKPLPAGCRLTAIFDCCHSGSALDLPYIYSTEGKLKEPNLGKDAAMGLLDTFTSYQRGDMSAVMSGVKGLFGIASGGQKKTNDRIKQTKMSPADVISWSGCKDTQTSADTQEAGQATGAMSWAFITSLTERPQQTYQELLVSIRALLKAKYSQKPQLSSSHPMDVNVIFIC